MSFLSLSTIATHVAQIWGASFHAYSIATTLLLTLTSFAFLYDLFRTKAKLIADFLKYLFPLSLFGFLLGLFSFRPGADDLYYVPNSRYFLENPRERLDFLIHFVGSRSEVISINWGTSLPYDYLRASISYVLDIDLLTSYYFLVPPFACFLIPISYFLLVSKFADNNKKVYFSTTVSIFILLVMGDTHRTPGNLSFVRFFHGKSLLLTIGVPVFAGASIDFFRTCSFRSWLLLFVTATGLIGATTSTVILLPALGSVFALSFLYASTDYISSIRKCALFFSSLSYVFVYAITFLVYKKNDLGMGSPPNEGYPTGFIGHFDFWLNPIFPITLFVVFFGSWFALRYYSGQNKRVFKLWLAFTVIAYVNPISAYFHIRYLTSPNIYWRLFYILPIIPILGAVGFWCYEWLVSRSRRTQLKAVGGALLFMIGLHFLPGSPSILASNLQLPPLEYPVPGNYSVAKRLTTTVPEGPMLAPGSIGGIVAMIDSEYPQMRIRTDGVRLWIGGDEAEDRIHASRHAGGNEQSLPSFRRVLSKPSLCSVVVHNEVARRSKEKKLLKSEGYTYSKKAEEYVAYWRSHEHCTPLDR